MNKEELEKKFNELDNYTKGHSVRVEKLAQELGKELKLEKESYQNLTIAARYHDIGKTSIPKEIRDKKGIREKI